MLVDPGELRALANSMDDIGIQIDAIKMRADTTAVDTALPGSSLGQAGVAAGTAAADAWSRMALRWTEISAIVKASASNFEMTDVEFADRINTVGGDS